MEKIFKAKLRDFVSPIYKAVKENNLKSYNKSLIQSGDFNEISKWFYFLKFHKYILNDDSLTLKQFMNIKDSHEKEFNEQLIKDIHMTNKQ
jgi:hypothetical protein